jgi:transposase
MRKKESKTAIVARLLEQGLSTANIAKKAKCSVGYVYKIKSEMKQDESAVEEWGWQEHAQKLRDITDTLDERGKRYGLFVGQAQASQELKAVVYRILTERDTPMAPDQREAMEMICHKMARIMNGDPNYSDSWHDIAGYAKLVADRLEGKLR